MVGVRARRQRLIMAVMLRTDGASDVSCLSSGLVVLDRPPAVRYDCVSYRFQMGYNLSRGTWAMAVAKPVGKKKGSDASHKVVGSNAVGGTVPVPGKVVGELTRGKPAPMSGVIRARVDPALKARAEAILGRVGLNPSDAIRVFYSQVTLHGGLPFEVKVPNAETRKAMRDADAGKGTAYASAEEMFKKMGL